MEILKAKVLISVWIVSRGSKHTSLRFITLQIPHSIPCGFPTGHGVRLVSQQASTDVPMESDTSDATQRTAPQTIGKHRSV